MSKVFYLVHGDNGEFGKFFLKEVVSECDKSSLGCMKNTLKSFKHIGEDFAVYGE
jgi:hypothetical protein